MGEGREAAVVKTPASVSITVVNNGGMTGTKQLTMFAVPPSESLAISTPKHKRNKK